MSDIVKWSDSPPPTRYRHLQRALAELKAHPGQWGCVRDDCTPKTAGSVSRGMKRAGCESVTRVNKETKWVEVWAMWPKGEG